MKSLNIRASRELLFKVATFMTDRRFCENRSSRDE